jgi:cell division protease FtsH
MTLEKPRRTTRRLAAYHEAGHAVASYFLPSAGPTTWVTIRREDLCEDDAGAHFSEPRPALRDGAGGSPDVVRAKAVVGLAGIEVDRRLTGNAFTSGGDDDDEVRQLIRDAFLDREIQDAVVDVDLEVAGGTQDLEEIASRVSESVEDDLKRILDSIRGEAQALIESHWPQVEAVAKALLEREVLSGDETRCIIESVD